MPNAEWRTSEEIGGDLGREVFTVALNHVPRQQEQGAGEKNKISFLLPFSRAHVKNH
jgi:hypothetical protein